MTQLLYVDGSSKDFGSRFWYGRKWGNRQAADQPIVPGGNRWTVVEDLEAPGGTALHNAYFTGDGDGWAGLAEWASWRATRGDMREIYVRAWVKFSPNWQTHRGGGSKVISLRIGALDRSSEIHLVRTGTRVTLREVSDSPGPDDNPSFRRDGLWPANGEWAELELYMVAQSEVGSSDGWGRLWINGLEVDPFPQWAAGQDEGDFATPMWSWVAEEDPPGFRGIQFGTYWGGSGDVKEVDDFVRWGEVYISGRPYEDDSGEESGQGN